MHKNHFLDIKIEICIYTQKIGDGHEFCNMF